MCRSQSISHVSCTLPANTSSPGEKREFWRRQGHDQTKEYEPYQEYHQGHWPVVGGLRTLLHTGILAGYI